MLPTIMLALCMQTGGSQQPQKLKVDKPVVSISRQSTKRQTHDLASRHLVGRRIPWRTAQATVFTVAENGRATANNEHCFSNGPEYLCALPSNLNPNRKYCQHKKDICRPIYVTTKAGDVITVHVVDHCPHNGVIDFNPASANKIFLNKTSSTPDWWSRSRVKWFRD